tara:strand:- start:407 stop:697 length:291 start_codon:yes stop_codon:yes gene_type:complete
MPSQSSIDIVNTVFGGGKDLSDYVDSRMKELAMDSIDSMKQEVGKQLFTPTPETPDEGEETEAEKQDDAEAPGTPSSVEDTSTEEPSDETDNGNNS